MGRCQVFRGSGRIAPSRFPGLVQGPLRRDLRYDLRLTASYLMGLGPGRGGHWGSRGGVVFAAPSGSGASCNGHLALRPTGRIPRVCIDNQVAFGARLSSVNGGSGPASLAGGMSIVAVQPNGLKRPSNAAIIGVCEDAAETPALRGMEGPWIGGLPALGCGQSVPLGATAAGPRRGRRGARRREGDVEELLAGLAGSGRCQSWRTRRGVWWACCAWDGGTWGAVEGAAGGHGVADWRPARDVKPQLATRIVVTVPDGDA